MDVKKNTKFTVCVKSLDLDVGTVLLFLYELCFFSLFVVPSGGEDSP